VPTSGDSGTSSKQNALGDMDRTRWLTLSPYLDQALDLEPEALPAWLAALRTREPQIAADLSMLLDERADLNRKQFLATGLGPFDTLGGFAGQTLGAYTVDALIGRGGMGSVWLAHRSDGRYDARVAVKLLNAALARHGGEERFRREGALLGRLAHRHIARLFDAGVSPSGQPYLVLEYVEGTSIDRHADERSLAVDARVRLFLDVLSAVAHAHGHLIVHRDLKPSNVLVTRDGEVKLVDFGIAKLLQDEAVPGESAALTREAGQALTPEYAAPEQVLGGPIVTGTDVYALGVLLHVLLGGVHPSGDGVRTPIELIRSIVDVTPARLSDAVAARSPELLAAAAATRGVTPDRLVRSLRGDLDNIVGKALKKDPNERYASVTAFAEDLRRYLAHEPVGARPDTLAYRIGKFVRRHRVGVITGTAMIVALAATTGIALWQMIEANAQRDAAVFQSKHANASNAFMASLLQDFGRSMTSASMREQLDRAHELLKTRTFEHPIIKASLFRQLAARYGELGDVGMHLALVEEVDRIVQATDETIAKAESKCSLGNALEEAGRLREARAQFDQAKSYLAREDDLLARVECSIFESYVASAQGDHASALALSRKATAELENANMTTIPLHRISRTAQARAIGNAGNVREALPLIRRLMREQEAAGAKDSIRYHRLALIEASYLAPAGKPRDAVAASEEAMLRSKRLEPGGQPGYPVLLAHGLNQLATGSADEAVTQLAEAARDAKNKGAVTAERRATLSLVEAQLTLGRVEDARRSFESARAWWEATVAEALPDAALVRYLQSRLLYAAGGVAEAAVALDDAERLVQASGNSAHPQMRAIAIARVERALAASQVDIACRYADQALARARTDALDPQSSAWIGEALMARARCELARPDAPAAAAIAREAMPHLDANLGGDHPLTIEARTLAGNR
jgi:serine/threonine-protein kinase